MYNSLYDNDDQSWGYRRNPSPGLLALILVLLVLLVALEFATSGNKSSGEVRRYNDGTMETAPTIQTSCFITSRKWTC